MKKSSFIFILLFSFMFLPIVNASTYTTDTNLFENTYSNNLFDMAKNQIKNFTNLKYVVFQNGYNYYLVASKDITVSNNSVTFNSSEIINAIRTQANYSYYYDYFKTTENSTTVNINNIVISNIEGLPSSITGKRYDEFQYYSNVRVLGMFILGLLFAVFLTKERRY